jgi:hypothetical protein
MSASHPFDTMLDIFLTVLPPKSHHLLCISESRNGYNGQLVIPAKPDIQAHTAVKL